MTAASSADLLADERYIALTTFTRDGTPRSVPVWPVDAGDGRIGFITSRQTWKVKRINHDCRVEVQPCDAKGRVREGTQAVSASAQVVVGVPFEALRSTVKAKYGYQLRFIDFLHALPGRRTGHRNDCAVVISLDAT
jgi:PPOX class probable F420-dependent enzyme